MTDRRNNPSPQATNRPAGFFRIEEIMNRTQSFLAPCCFAVALAGCVRQPPVPDDKAPAPNVVQVIAQPAGSAAKIDPSAPWPMFGGANSRNMVNTTAKNVPTTWIAEEGKLKNIKWVAQLGNHCFAGPVVGDGKVFVGTNSHNSRDKNVKPGTALLIAFNETDGKFLWQNAHTSPDDALFNEGRSSGMCSTPVIEGKRLYYVTPGCEVVCAETTGTIQWKYDMMKELKVIPHHLSNCSPLIVGDLIMVVTGNGVDDQGDVASAKAPSFIAVNKKTGKLVWESNLPGANIIEGQWSNPVAATVNGKTQVIFPGGDCVLYSFEPETGKLLWKCDCFPTRQPKGVRENDIYIVATPVTVGARLYLGLGVCPDSKQRPKYSYCLCLDITKQGDVSPKNYDPKDAVNKNSALVWAFGGPILPPPAKGRQVRFGPTMSTVAIHDGLLYLTEEAGYLHCLDVKTGQLLWDHDFKTSIWSSPYCVDGKVYIGTNDGDVIIFAQGKERKYYLDGKLEDPSPKNDKRLPSASMDDNDVGTPVVANGVLFIATKSKLFAIANGK
jgi:outer membrane protein assembly factor BamB